MPTFPAALADWPAAALAYIVKHESVSTSRVLMHVRTDEMDYGFGGLALLRDLGLVTVSVDGQWEATNDGRRVMERARTTTAEPSPKSVEWTDAEVAVVIDSLAYRRGQIQADGHHAPTVTSALDKINSLMTPSTNGLTLTTDEPVLKSAGIPVTEDRTTL